MQDVDAIIDAVPDLMNPQQLTQSLSNLVAWFPNHDPFELLQQNPQILENPNVEADPTYGKSWAESSLLAHFSDVTCVLVCCACMHHSGVDALRQNMHVQYVTSILSLEELSPIHTSATASTVMPQLCVVPACVWVHCPAAAACLAVLELPGLVCSSCTPLLQVRSQQQAEWLGAWG